MKSGIFVGLGIVSFAIVVACSSSSGGGNTDANGDVCSNITADSRFPGGDPTGHADPFGAKAAGQARAGVLTDASQIKRPDDARNRVQVGDFAIANDKIAAYIAGARKTDGYVPYGGKVLTIDVVGDDGKPLGVAEYGETLFGFSRETITPDSVTVMNDGSDGNAAVIRATGVLKSIPFLDAFKAIFPRTYGFPVAIDYTLEPHAEKLGVKVSLMNTGATDTETFTGLQIIGMFHSYRSKFFTEGAGFADPKGMVDWAGYDGTTSSHAIRAVNSKMNFGADISGFQYFALNNGLSIDPCTQQTIDYAEIVPAAGGIDNVRTTVARIDGTALATLSGTVKEQGGTAVAGALVHATAADGTYVTRGVTDATGAFTIHVPSGALSLAATAPGYPVSPAVSVASGATTAAVTMPTRGTIHVTATDMAKSTGIPVRVQVLPQPAYAAAPASYGVDDEDNGRLYQSFAMNGDITLPAPPGMHRVIVTRGYEWELSDQTVTVTAGQPTNVAAPLAHSVDSTGVMCADFHIHSYYSVDAGDTTLVKVQSAIADGLEIPVSSEHEWIIDFQPLIQKLGVTQFAFGFPSEELTTFTFGHFGVVPKMPDTTQVNLGAVDWVGKTPGQIFDEVNALPEQPVLIINHPIGTTFMGYFTAAQFDNTKGAGTDPNMWSDHFEAIEVFNDSDFDSNKTDSVASWFSMLGTGKKVWAIGNSDSHHIRGTPVGYPRNCIQFGHDDPTKLTANTVRDQVRKGAFTVSGGLTIAATGPDGKGPGDTSTAGAFKVTVQAPSWLNATTLETYVDGALAHTDALTAATGGTSPAHVYTTTVNVAASAAKGPHYVVFHAKGSTDLAPLHPGRKPFAVTNPIFF
jgi:hypothetical protein